MKRTDNKRKGFGSWVFITAIILLPCIAYPMFTWLEDRLTPPPVYGSVTNKNSVQQEHIIPVFSLTNQEGKRVNSTQWQGKIVVANFIFTYCPVVCPRMTTNLKAVQKAFEKDSSVQMISFTVDPERDSSQQLQKFADRFEININQWQLLTGDKATIYRLARNAFLVTATDGDGGPNDFIHSEKVVLIDQQQRIRGFYTGTEKSEIETLVKDINKLKNEEE